ncbi:hypothetical protein J6590_045823 [Homalodisca vitripennis]|nr:hypothetical protein J6590_045823 [Homalodisca vitripennis]
MFPIRERTNATIINTVGRQPGGSFVDTQVPGSGKPLRSNLYFVDTQVPGPGRPLRSNLYFVDTQVPGPGRPCDRTTNHHHNPTTTNHHHNPQQQTTTTTAAIELILCRYSGARSRQTAAIELILCTAAIELILCRYSGARKLQTFTRQALDLLNTPRVGVVKPPRDVFKVAVTFTVTN